MTHPESIYGLTRAPEGHVLIPTNRRDVYALVDPEDVELVVGYRWHVVRAATNQYAATYAGGKAFRMHRLILPGVAIIDHANGNGLDNRRSNLRPATHTENMRNRRATPRFNVGLKGVSWRKKDRLWNAQIMVDWKKISLGYYKTALEAALAYDAGARQHFGEFARVNFPDGSPSPDMAAILETLPCRDDFPRVRSGTPSKYGFRGVRLDKRWQRWSARIYDHGRELTVGQFSTAEEAARAYDDAARRLHGDAAILNFPDELDEAA